MSNFFFFGDSICFGQGVSLHHGWVTRLSALVEESAKIPLTVSNLGVNGNTTRQALERIPYDIQSHSVHSILIQFGLNDCNHWNSDRGLPRVSIGAFGENLKEIVERSKVHGARNIILNTNHPTVKPEIVIGDKVVDYQFQNRMYNRVIRSVADETNSTLNDIEVVFDAEISKGLSLNELLLPDGLHLSRKGHDIYFKEISKLSKSLGLI